MSNQRTVETEEPQRLVFDGPCGRWRLGPDPIEAGELFELEFVERVWVRVRFEWQHDDGTPKGIFIVGLPDELNAIVLPTEGARLRRPTETAACENQWLEYDELQQRHTLAGAAVIEGQKVEVQLADATWVRGIFELRAGAKRRAALRMPMAGISAVHESLLLLPDFAVLARRSA